MQEEVSNTIADIRENDLQEITGGCAACATDFRIIDAITRVRRADALIRVRGLRYPRGMNREEIIQAAERDFHAARASIAQRHPGAFGLNNPEPNNR